MDSFTVTGAAYERGVQWGSRFRENVREHAARVTEPRDWPVFKYGHAVSRHIYYVMDRAPELIDEIRGVAKGAGVSFEEAFNLTSGAALGFAKDDGCTNFAATTVDAGPILGKTEDPGAGTGPEWKHIYAMRKSRPAAGYRHITATRKHNLWSAAGMNEHGLAIGQSSGPYPQGNQDGSGINYLTLVQLALERCQTADEAVALLESLIMAGKGYIFMIADAQGNFRAVDKWHDRQGVRKSKDGALFFANRFEAPNMRDFPPRYDAEHSEHRFNNMKLQFEKARSNGGWTAQFMERMLRYHAPAGSICRHGVDTPADAGGLTGPAFLFKCASRQVGAYFGIPCQVEPEWFGFDF